MLQATHIQFEESIAHVLLQVEKRYLDQPAIAIGRETLTYQELFARAKQLAVKLMVSKENRCMILSRRSIAAYVGVLGALLAGKSYVFLNDKESISQLSQTILFAETTLLIVDENCLGKIGELDKRLQNKLRVLPINQQDQFAKNKTHYTPPKESYYYAYIMFTSGSTGKPKGVPISHKNLKTFVKNICERIKPASSDKFSHINELTFDFSVYEIFCCLTSGACLCVLPDNYLYGIDKYIEQHQITYWSSVPSVIQLLCQLKKLGTASFNSIRYSIFCGEALTQAVAKRWKVAAPNTIVDNLYGPTEATVAITGYLWHEKDSDEVVPMGQPFSGQGFYLVDVLGQIVETEGMGEVYLYGDQVASEYWNNPAITQECFTVFNGTPVYKTGDLAQFNKEKGLLFKGRKDDQLKLKGYRVEKMEIENRLKIILKTQAIAIVPMKDTLTARVNSLVCFYAGSDCSTDTVKSTCRKNLPYPMIPDEFFKLEQLPYNKNGKVDYQMLMCNRMVEKG